MCPSEKSYDVLLSYAPADAEWAEGWLLPRMERQNLRVFVINRDMLAGGARLEQLAEQAFEARHTLLVLSPAWMMNQNDETFTGLVSHSTDSLGRKRKTIPLLRQICKPPRSIARLINADFTSDNEEEWEREFTRLLAVLRGQQHRTALGPPLGALIGLESPTNVQFSHNPHFVGREQELAELHEFLDDATPLGINAARPDVRATSHLAGVTGLGGVGKTQLVVEYIYRFRQAYPGGVFWVNAADGLEQGLIAIGRILDPDGHEKKSIELVRTAMDYLRSDPETLLVLDNLNDPALLNQSVMGITSPLSLPCRVLFTTRRRDLHGLRSISVDVLTETDGLKLLLRSRPEILEMSHPEHSLAINVCATLGGLPLAIEMAASFLEQVPDVTLTGYLKRLGKYGALDTIDSIERAKEWSPTWHDPVQVTLLSQWDAVTDADARLLLQAASLMPEAATLPLTRLSLLTNLSAFAEEGFSSQLGNALRRLQNYSLIEQLEIGQQAYMQSQGDESVHARITSMAAFALQYSRENISSTFEDMLNGDKEASNRGKGELQVRMHPLVQEFVRARISDMTTFAKQCSTNMASALEDMLRVNKEILDHGIDTFLEDLKSGLNLYPGNAALHELHFVLDREAHNLRKAFYKENPSYILQQIYTRALNLQKTSLMKHAELALDTLRLPWLRERFPSSKEPPALQRTFEGHLGTINSIALTPDGKYAASAATDNMILLWELESGQCLRTFVGHKSSVDNVAITPDGKYIVSASDFDYTLRVWDIESGQNLQTFEHFSAYTKCSPLMPDGRHVITASRGGALGLWELANAQFLRGFEKTNSKLMAISPDGKYAISAFKNNSLCVWDLVNGQTLHTLEGHTDTINRVVITPDSKRALSAAYDNTLRVWNLENGQSLHIMQGHTIASDNRISDDCMAITADSKYAVTTTENSLCLWDLVSGKCLNTFTGHTSFIHGLAICPDGKRLVSAAEDGAVRVWDLESGQCMHIFARQNESIQCLAITLDGKFALSAPGSNLHLWDLEGDEVVRQSKWHSDAVYDVASNPDGKYAVSCSKDSTLRLWNTQSGQCLRTFEGHTESVEKVVITPEGRRVISASFDNTLRLWDLVSGQCLRILEGHTHFVIGVAIFSSGKYAASISLDHTLRLWDLKSGQCLKIFEIPIDDISSISITPDSKCAILYSRSNNIIWEWDLLAGQTRNTQAVCTTGAPDVKIIPGGKYIAESAYKTLRILSIENGQPFLEISGEGFRCVTTAQTGNLIIAGDSAGIVHFIDLIEYAPSKMNET